MDEQKKCQEQQKRHLLNIQRLQNSKTSTGLTEVSAFESARESLERNMADWKKKYEEKEKKRRDKLRQSIADASNKKTTNYSNTIKVSPIQFQAERPYSSISPEIYSQQQLAKLSSRNADWSSKSRLAQFKTEENKLRDQEVNKILLEDKINKSELRQTIAREQQRELNLFKSEKSSLKKFHQELSLQQQETDQKEWKDSVFQKQQQQSQRAEYLRNKRLNEVKGQLYRERKNKTQV